MIHPKSDVQSKRVGENTSIWQYVVVLEGAKIGQDCNISCNVFIENDVELGDSVTVKSGVQLWDGIRIKDNVFIGPNVSFTNDKNPRSKQYPDQFQKTVIREYASIGAGAVILGGIEIGAYALVGAGALVTRDVPARAMVIGQPAEIVAWVNGDGTKMKNRNGFWIDNKGQKWVAENNRLVKV
jgi:acetyltransferase-like isoleucine patch superfamily enzyme